ncbi:MAG: nuclear transport factor 2 family protein [Gaiellaceae bacterium]
MSAAQHWRDTWERAWRTHDADAVESLYAEDCVFTSMPFREPHHGAAGARAYAQWSFASEEAVECWFGEPVVDGDRATCEYWAVVRSEGVEQTIAGCAVIRFGPDDKVLEQRDYWNLLDSRCDPPPRWGG